MKNFIKLTGLIGIMLVIGFFTTSCKTLDSGEGNKLATPKNVKIEINVRQMIITWDAVPNALGYEIITTSENCGSGNRTINTKENTAVAPNGNNALAGGNNLAASNGMVQIHARNKVEITLMPEWNKPGDNQSGRNESKIMATSVTAKVKAIGGARGNTDSDFSETVTFDTSDL
ncbi:MAG: hypothetical protein FWB95_01325 [Treponema sp.]|nr:hypothetical protein [Treponema sp.]